MRVFGGVNNYNGLAILLGMLIIFLGLMIAYLFQKKLFGRLQGKVPNIRGNDET